MYILNLLHRTVRVLIWNLALKVLLAVGKNVEVVNTPVPSTTDREPF